MVSAVTWQCSLISAGDSNEGSSQLADSALHHPGGPCKLSAEMISLEQEQSLNLSLDGRVVEVRQILHFPVLLTRRACPRLSKWKTHCANQRFTHGGDFQRLFGSQENHCTQRPNMTPIYSIIVVSILFSIIPILPQYYPIVLQCHVTSRGCGIMWLSSSYWRSCRPRMGPWPQSGQSVCGDCG